jgi:hypothetical protein
MVEFLPGRKNRDRWIRVCDRCRQREAKERAERERLAQLEALWAARQCAAEGCSIVFAPAKAGQRFCCEAHRKRAHRKLKAGLGGRLQRAKLPG